MDRLHFDKHLPLDKTCLIEASAGTGKTFSITHIYLHAVLSGIPVEEILVVTYTEAATKELRSRIRLKLHDALECLKGRKRDETLEKIFELFKATDSLEKRKLLEEELLKMDRASIFTIHSFCQRMLTENAFESGISFGAELLTDPSKVIREIVEDFWRLNLAYVPEDRAAFYEKICFNDLLKLAGQLLKHRDAVIVNNTFPEPEGFSKLRSEYRALLDSAMPELEKYDISGLKRDLEDFFEEHAEVFKSKHKKPGPLIDKAVECLEKKEGIRNLEPFSYDYLRSKGVYAGKEVPEHPFFYFCSRFGKIFAKAEELEPAEKQMKKHLEVKLLNDLNSYARERFSRVKKERNLLTYDDLLERLRDALFMEKHDGPLSQAIRSKYRLALVDEFQDTDRIQYDIFNRLFHGRCGFYMIGDPKQSIYKFRSADIYCYLSAKRDAHRVFTLDTNYRSEKDMVAAANQLFLFKGREEPEGNRVSTKTFAFQDEFGGAGISYHEVSASGQIERLAVEDDEDRNSLRIWLADGFDKAFIQRNIAGHIAMEIVRLMNLSEKGKACFGSGKKKIRLGDFAVLVNTHRQAALLKKVFSQYRINAVLQNSGHIFESREARELQLWLKAVARPTESRIRPLLISRLMNRGAEELDRISEQEILDIAEELSVVNRMWQKNGFTGSFFPFMERHRTRERVLLEAGGPRVITNYVHLAELLQKQEILEGPCLEKTMAHLERGMRELELEEEYEQRLESDGNSVKIMTIHKSKGLEFPIVFCPYMWTKSVRQGERGRKLFLFNEEENGNYVQKLDFGADKELAGENGLVARRETLAEYVRLLYVAVTRAAHRCYISVGRADSSAESVFGYIFTGLEPGGSKQAPGLVDRISGLGNVAAKKKILDEIVTNIGIFAENAANASLEKKTGPAPILPLKESEEESAEKLRAEKFTRGHIARWSVGSFTALTASHPYGGEASETGTGVFALPKGKHFGTAVHRIFDNYFKHGKDEFGKNPAEFFEDPLKTDSFFRAEDRETRERRFRVARKMFDNALETPIEGQGTRIVPGELAPGDVKSEFPFFYQISRLSPQVLENIFETHGVDGIKDFAAELGKLDFSLRRGYMTGEIDLLFRHAGKYYLLDWKTNHLGCNASDYGEAELRRSMFDHCYFLQYHIYSLAVHLFLGQRMKGYEYRSHFGGVFYIYTRGVGSGGNGVFFDRPPEALIKKLEKELVGFR